MGRRRLPGDAYGAFGYAACAVESRSTDLETAIRGARDAARTSARAIHPVLAAGQIDGGVTQGLGCALLESAVYEKGG